jgi:flagellar hook-length control protein FliK
MRMIQNAAMFQDATPVAAMQSGKGPVSALQPSDSKGGGFAKILKGRQSPGDDAADASSNGDPAEVAGGNAPPRPATSIKGQKTGQTATPQKAQQSAGESIGADGSVKQPGRATVSDGEAVRSDLRKGLAAEDQRSVLTADPTQQAKAVTVAVVAGGELAKPNPGKAKGADGSAVRNDLKRKSLAAEAQRSDQGQGSLQQGEEATAADGAKQVPVQAKASDSGKDTGKIVSDFKHQSVAVAAPQIAPSIDPAQLGAAGATVARTGDSWYPMAGTLGNRYEIRGLEAKPNVVLAKLEQTGALAAAPADGLSGRMAEKGAVAAADIAPAGPVTVAPVAERGDVVLAKAGTVADKGQELSRLPSFQAGQQNASPLSQKTVQSPVTPGTATQGTASQGTASQGTATQGTATQGTATQGTATQGTATQGTATQGTATQGTATQGTATQGTATQGTATQGTATQGTATQGTATSVTITPGTAEQGFFTASNGSNAQQESGAAAPMKRQGRASAEGFVPTPVGRPSLQAAQANPVTISAKDVPAAQDHAAAPQIVDTPKSEVVSEGDAVTVVAKDETRQAGTATGATEGAQKEVPAAGEKVQAPTANGLVAEQQVKVETAPLEGTLSSDKGAQWAADRKDPRTAGGAQTLHVAEKSAVEQAGGVPKVSTEEAFGIKTATNVAGAKFVPLQGDAGQGGSGDTGKKEHQEQKAQDVQSPQAQSLGLGAQTVATAEVAQPEAKPVNLKSALHESILAQVKDGVVTHDGKGTSQISIRLNPGELGELKIQVRMENNQVRVEVQADNKMVKDLLMNNLDTLKDALSSKNFTMEGFDVSTGGGFNSPLNEEKGNTRQQAMLRSAKAGGYSGQEEGRVNYLTADVNNLLDVRF